MESKQHPALIIVGLLLATPVAIWLMVLVVGVISSIGGWFDYSTGVH